MQNDERFKELLREAIGPVADSELKRDLWPQMLRKLDRQAIRVPWYDWALAAMVAVWLCYFPEAILALVYHL
jgi:hypothetical protein